MHTVFHTLLYIQGCAARGQEKKRRGAAVRLTHRAGRVQCTLLRTETDQERNNMEISVGTLHTEQTVVTEPKLATTYGSGEVGVFATPAMVALMEQAASACVRPFLDAGQVTVGAAVHVDHTAATPLGAGVRATAVVTAVDGRRIDFAVTAEDDAGVIGRGTHTRYIVDRQKFEAKAAGRKGR